MAFRTPVGDQAHQRRPQRILQHLARDAQADVLDVINLDLQPARQEGQQDDNGQADEEVDQIIVRLPFSGSHFSTS